MDGQWWFEHGLADGDEAVIEWTMTWRDPKSGERRLNRGTEWFRLEDGRIAEVRAYHHGDRGNPQRRPARLRLRRAGLHDARD